jgi:hypothetical protein
MSAEVSEAVAIHLVGVRQTTLRTGPDGPGIAVAGQVDVANADTLAATLEAATRTATDVVWLDLEAVERQLAGGARQVRLVGEVDFGEGPATWSEWIRYESVVNVALAPARFLRRSQTAEPDPLQATAPVLAAEDLFDTGQLSTLRDRLRTELVRALVPNPVRSDFVSAVSEVTANGLLHGPQAATTRPTGPDGPGQPGRGSRTVRRT